MCSKTSGKKAKLPKFLNSLVRLEWEKMCNVVITASRCLLSGVQVAFACISMRLEGAFERFGLLDSLGEAHHAFVSLVHTATTKY